jgi:hypothetical protein
VSGGIAVHCLDYKSLNKMPDWYKRTDLNLREGEFNLP